MCKLVSPTFDSPENVLKFARLHYIQSLRKSGQLIRVSLLSRFAQVVFVISHKLFNFFPGVAAVHAVVLRTAAGKSYHCVGEHFSAIVSFDTVRENLTPPFDEILADTLE